MRFCFVLLSLLTLLSLLSSCQSKIKKISVDSAISNKVPDKVSIPAVTTESKNVFDWNCEDPSFSASGEQLIFWCTLPIISKQKQVFVKDFNTSETKQVTFINGRLQGPQLIDNDIIVFSSDTDKKKEILTLDPVALESDSLFELYLYNLKENEMLRLTENSDYDGQARLLKNIDPKIILLRKKNTAFQVISKHLSTFKEKVLYTTTNKISEISTNNSNNILIVEETTNKKTVKILKAEKEQFLWSDIDKSKYNFNYNPDNETIEYLEPQVNGTVLKSFNKMESCEFEIFTFPLKKISQINKSPLDAQTYVWVEEVNGVKKMNLGTLKVPSVNSCKKLSKKEKYNRLLL